MRSSPRFPPIFNFFNSCIHFSRNLNRGAINSMSVRILPHYTRTIRRHELGTRTFLYVVSDRTPTSSHHECHPRDTHVSFKMRLLQQCDKKHKIHSENRKARTKAVLKEKNPLSSYKTATPPIHHTPQNIDSPRTTKLDKDVPRTPRVHEHLSWIKSNMRRLLPLERLIIREKKRRRRKFRTPSIRFPSTSVPSPLIPVPPPRSIPS